MSSEINVLLNELRFRLNTPYEDLKDNIEPHSIDPTSYYETKYSLYKSCIEGFNSIFKMPFIKETILLFYDEVLHSVFYKVAGNQLDFFHSKLIPFVPKEFLDDIETTDRNSIVYKLSNDLLIEVLLTPKGTTGICVMNSYFRKDHYKSIPEKEYELMLINNNISL